ncbi:MAG: hypothetical protein NTY89_08700 [Nostocales cyanobacterium LacPavin_0920_SED1_MAG_38_18]|nr:hypothetical protein [Nostocales cyanobacterium LacPavin_0920_SED1_MAG_38_18]
MSNLFTAVSVEQQETVAGGFLDVAETVITNNQSAAAFAVGFGNLANINQSISQILNSVTVA